MELPEMTKESSSYGRVVCVQLVELQLYLKMTFYIRDRL